MKHNTLELKNSYISCTAINWFQLAPNKCNNKNTNSNNKETASTEKLELWLLESSLYRYIYIYICVNDMCDEWTKLVLNARTSTDLTVGIHSNGYPKSVEHTDLSMFLYVYWLYFWCCCGVFFLSFLHWIQMLHTRYACIGLCITWVSEWVLFLVCALRHPTHVSRTSNIEENDRFHTCAATMAHTVDCLLWLYLFVFVCCIACKVAGWPMWWLCMDMCLCVSVWVYGCVWVNMLVLLCCIR